MKKEKLVNSASVNNGKQWWITTRIWLIIIFSLAWSIGVYYSAQKCGTFIEGAQAFEQSICLSAYAIVVYMMSRFIYSVLFRWAGRQYFAFLLTYGAAFCAFVLFGVIAFSLFMETAGTLLFHDFCAVRLVAPVIGIIGFLRLVYLVFKDM